MAKVSTTEIRTAVFPVAGRGTRFLPATKASPKEMLPIVDKPLIQYAAEEALAAGARKLVFITGSSKRAIEDHFDSDHELEEALEAQKKYELLKALKDIVPSWASCIYIRQPSPLGLGHAVWCAKPVVGDEPFFVHLADDLIDAPTPCLRQMAEVHAERGGSVLGVETVPRAETDKYGIVATEEREGRISNVKQIVEKPRPSGCAVDAGRGRPLSVVADHFRQAREHRSRRGRRDSAHRRDRRPARRRERVCLRVRRQALRLRQQARLSASHRGIRPEARQPRHQIPRLSA